MIDRTTPEIRSDINNVYVTVTHTSFFFTSAAVDYLQLEKGMFVIFDEEELLPDTWTFYQTDKPLGFKLTSAGGPGKNKSNIHGRRGLRITNKALATYFRKYNNYPMTGSIKLKLEKDTSMPGSKLVKIITT